MGGGGGKTEGNQQKGREVGVTGQVCECGWGARLTEIKKRKHEGREGGKKNHWIWDGGGGGGATDQEKETGKSQWTCVYECVCVGGGGGQD